MMGNRLTQNQSFAAVWMFLVDHSQVIHNLIVVWKIAKLSQDLRKFFILEEMQMQMQIKSIVIQPANPFPPLSQQRIEHLDVAFSVVVNLAIFLMIGVLICADIPKNWWYSFRFDSSKQIPCRRCQYFNDNQFLKCTLHPVTTMTKQAIDCCDYCPHNKEKRIKQESGALSYSSSWRSIVQNIFHK
jgi:hypothetical protein